MTDTSESQPVPESPRSPAEHAPGVLPVPAAKGEGALAAVHPGPIHAAPAMPARPGLARRGLRGMVALTGWAALRLLTLDHPLLREDAFRAFWLSRLLGQAAQGAVLYALLVVIVDRTDDPFYGSLFVACSIVPSLLLGLPGGLLVDALPRRALMVWLNVLRAMAVLMLIASEPPLWLIFAVTLAIWIVHQAYNPAEGTTPATLVPERVYADAQALANLALTYAQLLGMVIAGPVLLRFGGPPALFAFCGALFLGVAGLVAILPRRADEVSAVSPAMIALRLGGGWRDTLLAGWRLIRADHAAFRAMADDVLVGVGLSALVVIAPFYLVRVLGTAAENTVFVFAPAALGLVLGLRLAPGIGRLIGLQRAVSVALILFAASIGSLGFVEQLRNAAISFGVPLPAASRVLGIPSLILVAMLISVPAGFASAVMGVSARAVLLARAPAEARGQVIATQNVLGNLGALIPTLLAGATADWLGVETIAVLIAVVILCGALAASVVSRRILPAPLAVSSSDLSAQ
ncbi:MAG: hypothetical protein C4289_00670 [Chloroflexota bacterium]